ncbi:MAG: hypothetical protein AVDCRST_MAG13-2366, partial [uncultured Solirubrobacteraceae bacterium]
PAAGPRDAARAARRRRPRGRGRPRRRLPAPDRRAVDAGRPAGAGGLRPGRARAGGGGAGRTAGRGRRARRPGERQPPRGPAGPRL